MATMTDRAECVRQLQREIADRVELAAADDELADAYDQMISERRDELLRPLRGEQEAAA